MPKRRDKSELPPTSTAGTNLPWIAAFMAVGTMDPKFRNGPAIAVIGTPPSPMTGFHVTVSANDSTT